LVNPVPVKQYHSHNHYLCLLFKVPNQLASTTSQARKIIPNAATNNLLFSELTSGFPREALRPANKLLSSDFLTSTKDDFLSSDHYHKNKRKRRRRRRRKRDLQVEVSRGFPSQDLVTSNSTTDFLSSRNANRVTPRIFNDS
jgi:hypothetical protein